MCVGTSSKDLMVKISVLCEIAINVRIGKFQEPKHDNVLNVKSTWRNMYFVPLDWDI